jgi:predicted DNA-binding transcriptional regulator YafY
MYQLIHCQEGDRVRKNDLADEFDITGKTIQRDIQFFIQYKLIEPNVHTGYRPQPKFFRLINRLEAIDPQKYNFDVFYDEVYPS